MKALRRFALTFAAVSAVACLGTANAQTTEAAAAPAKAASTKPAKEELASKGLAAFFDGFFSYGAGEITVTESRPNAVSGYRVVRVTKKRAGKDEGAEQCDSVLDDEGRVALIGFLFADDERAGKGPPVTTDEQLSDVAELVRGLVGPMRIRLTLDPALDIPGWKGVKVSIDTGYGFYGVPAHVSARDGAVLLIGTAWERSRSIPEQRRQRMKLDASPSQGTGTITVVEFSDLQCPFCKKRSGDFEHLLAKLPEAVKVKRVFKSFPLTSVHPWAFRAASAGRCLFRKDPSLYSAWKSGVYSRQGDFTIESLDAFAVDFAAANGIAGEEFLGCYLQPKASEEILAEIAEGFSIGVRSTPTYFVDGVMVTWADDAVMETVLKEKAGVAGKVEKKASKN